MFRSPLMADELLSYYEKELAFIRQMGAEFARENPKIASRLGINVDTIEDPHVSRLVESFAYLNARIHHKLEDRKSTRLNSSHVAISYAVFCLKKKKKETGRLLASKKEVDI